MLEGVLGVVVEAQEGDEGGGGDVDGDGGGAVEEVQETVRRTPLSLPLLVLLVVLVVERDDVVLLGEGPPPLEALPRGQTELRLLAVFELGDELDDVTERPGGSPVVRHVGDLAAELQDGHLLGLRQPHLVQHLHPLGLAQDVVVERPLGYPVPGTGLGKPQPLSDDGLDGVLELGLAPVREFAILLEMFVAGLRLSRRLDRLQWSRNCGQGLSEERLGSAVMSRTRSGLLTDLHPRPLALGLHAQVLGQRVVLHWWWLHPRQLQAPGRRQEGVQAVRDDGDVPGVGELDDADKVLVGDIGQYQDALLEILS